MTLRSFARLCALGGTVAFVTGCEAGRLLSDDPHPLSGITASSQPDGEAVLVRLREVTTLNAPFAYQEVLLRVRSSARVFRRERDQSLTRIPWNTLVPEQLVQVWTTGVEQRSLIPIYDALKVVVIPPVD